LKNCEVSRGHRGRELATERRFSALSKSNDPLERIDAPLGAPGHATISLPIKPFYSLTELARICAVERRVLRKLLTREGVEILGGGKLSFVSLSEIERKLPTFFEGIKSARCLLEALR
jgi:hypothetical protein